jgi:hypothetical protein
MNKELRQAQLVTDFTDQDQILGVFGNTVGRTTMKDLKEGIIKNNDLYLNQVAFYIDVNEPASTPLKVNVGGNREMFNLWVREWKAGVMDQTGNFAELSREDNRYFADGSPAVDPVTGSAVAALANANFMGKIPRTGCYIQTVEIAGKTIQRLWLSLLDLPGWTEPAQYVGMFKGWVDGSGRLRSVPNVVPTRSKTVKQFWDSAQLYGKSYGLAGVHFRNMLLWYMMAAYGQRGSQECELADATKVWGPGLDGTGSAVATNQYTIVTGQTLSLGTADGKSSVLDSAGATCNSVKVLSFENPWGQFWEFDGHMCSINNDVVVWRDNFMPATSAPTMADFEKIKTFVAHRHSAAISNTATTAHKMNLIAMGEQAAFMFPYAVQAGVSYNDYFYYNIAGQVWLWGGRAESGAKCGLACSASHPAWALSNSSLGARLAYFGDVNEISGGDMLA